MFGATASVHRMCVACLTHSVVFGEKNCCNWKKNNNSESFVSISLILFYLFANFLFLLTFVAIDLLQLCLLPIQCYQIKTLFFYPFASPMLCVCFKLCPGARAHCIKRSKIVSGWNHATVIFVNLSLVWHVTGNCISHFSVAFTSILSLLLKRKTTNTLWKINWYWIEQTRFDRATLQ